MCLGFGVVHSGNHLFHIFPSSDVVFILDLSLSLSAPVSLVANPK